MVLISKFFLKRTTGLTGLGGLDTPFYTFFPLPTVCMALSRELYRKNCFICRRKEEWKGMGYQDHQDRQDRNEIGAVNIWRREIRYFSRPQASIRRLHLISSQIFWALIRFPINTLESPHSVGITKGITS